MSFLHLLKRKMRQIIFFSSFSIIFFSYYFNYFFFNYYIFHVFYTFILPFTMEYKVCNGMFNVSQTFFGLLKSYTLYSPSFLGLESLFYILLLPYI